MRVVTKDTGVPPIRRISAYFRNPTLCDPHAGAYFNSCDSSNDERNTVRNISQDKMSISTSDKPLDVVIVCLHIVWKMI